ncbi:carboxymuconolactone decarboxylase family protein [Flavivirga sp. 57AJ16]|uniref:carboxymuconolactone decarboxylase family protein n=1 Tax=Flavivirga sp. 57AJ16 TaxID=3025307 RepID=UPI0023651611|nr:carboxymuconolactone decarboxylase family protein [Flavivirga sp. 57AJ16]MDD7886210.1 carboxymuconolactone decarboxylase family protein [Flavivirga sp. 57AJ16]
MKSRVNIYQSQPKAYEGMFALESFLNNSPLNKKQISLIKMRASQINGCAYCINMHTEEALKAGETHQRLHLLNAWKESSLFSEEEKVILKMTEEITLIQQKELTDETYNQATRLFDEETIIAIIMAATIINAWNRIAISTRLGVG